MKKLALYFKRQNFTIIGILCSAFILRLINLNQSFWLDEAAQVIESIRPLAEQFQLASDFHPPLFHLILHLWLYIGTSENWIRLLPVLFGMASVVVIYKLGLFIENKRVAVLSALFLATSPFHIWYSQETRPYMLFLLLSLLSTLYLLRKRWFLFTVIIILTAYTNYFFIFLIAGFIIHVLLFKRDQLRNLLSSLVILFAFYLPWIPEFFIQLKIGTNGIFTGWTGVVSEHPVKALFLTLAKFSVGKVTLSRNPIFILIIIPVILIFIYSLINLYKKSKYKFLAFLFLVQLFSAFLLSMFIPVLAPQRLIFLLPVFILIISSGVVGIKRGLMYLLILTVITANLSGLLNYYTDPYTQREQWREAVNLVESTAKGNSVALFVFPDPFAPYLWYGKNRVPGYGLAPQFIFKQEDIKNMDELIYSRDRIFLFQYLTGLTDPQNLARKNLEASNYKLASTDDFPGVGFVYTYDKQ